MVISGIPFVVFEPVARILAGIVSHKGITMLLGNNGGCGNRLGPPITSDKGLLGNRQIDGVDTVDQEEVGTDIQVLYGPSHGEQARPKHIELVDFRGARETEGRIHGGLMYERH